MSPRYYRDRLMRFWWVLLLCSVCAGLGGWIGGVLLFTVYSSTALIQVEVRSTTPDPSTQLFIDRLTHTGAQLAVSDNILTRVARSNNMTLSKLHSEVTANPLSNTQLVAITIRDASSNRAANLANEIAQAVVAEQNHGIEQINIQSQQAYISTLSTLSSNLADLKSKLAALGQPPSDPAQAKSLQTQIEAAQGQYDLAESTLTHIRTIQATESLMLRVSSPAAPSAGPVVSHQVVTVLAGMVFGLSLGVFLIVGGEWINSRVQGPDSVADAFQWVRIGIPPVEQGRPSSKPKSVSYSDMVDALTSDIAFLALERPLRAIALVSANPSVRTWDFTARLASAFARSKRNTLLIDAHLRDGIQGRTFGVSSVPGLSDVMLTFSDAKPTSPEIMAYLRSPVQHANPFLLILPAGTRPPNPDRLLASDLCKQAITALVSLPAEVTLLDTPVALFHGESELLRKALDGVVILVDPDTARHGDLARLARALDECETPVLGFVYTDQAITEFGASVPASHFTPEEQTVGR